MIVNTTTVIDSSRITSFHIRVFLLCGLVAFLDGYDIPVLAFAAPVIAAELQISMPSFALIFVSSTVGGAIGALILGPLADRYGRKRLLVAATIIFGGFTIVTPLAASFQALFFLRLLAGIGLGGAIPSLISLASEYAPRRVRSLTITTMWAAFPLGGLAAGLLAAQFLGTGNWRGLLYVGGALPLIVAVVIAVAMPDSLKFLVVRGTHAAQARLILQRLDPALAFGPDVVLAADRETTEGTAVVSLFRHGRGRMTLLLWVAFFMNFGILAILITWAPTLLAAAGLPLSNAAIIVALNNLGSLFGMLSIGKLIDRFGVFVVLPAALFLGAACSGVLGLTVSSYAVLAAAMTLSGFFLGGSASGLIALCATLYPTLERSAGLGWGTGLGRVGQIVGPLVGGALLGAHWGIENLFLVTAIPPLCACLVIILLRREQAARNDGIAASPIVSGIEARSDA